MSFSYWNMKNSFLTYFNLGAFTKCNCLGLVLSKEAEEPRFSFSRFFISFPRFSFSLKFRSNFVIAALGGELEVKESRQTIRKLMVCSRDISFNIV